MMAGESDLLPELVRLRQNMVMEEERHTRRVDEICRCAPVTCAANREQSTVLEKFHSRAMEKSKRESKLLVSASFQLAHALDSPTVEANETGIIHEGLLRKARIRGVGPRQTLTWRPKLVQLREGLLVYADEQRLGRETKAKSLPLRLGGRCVCRLTELTVSLPNRSSHEPSSGNRSPLHTTRSVVDVHSQSSCLCAFELIVDGARRVWSAGTRDECRKWVVAINSAMNEGLMDDCKSNVPEISPAQEIEVPDGSPYAADIASYLSIRQRLRNAVSAKQYSQAISPLLHRSPLAGGLVIPVEWAKRHLVVNQSIFGASKKYGSAAIAQLRKDMSRDIAYINGRIVNGDEGIESIVAELVQSILDRTKELDGMLSIDEGQALLIAREALLACNRTTSAGDTYLVIDELCRNRDLVILVPAMHEAQPLVVDIVAEHDEPSIIDEQREEEMREPPDQNQTGGERSSIRNWTQFGAREKPSTITSKSAAAPGSSGYEKTSMCKSSSPIPCLKITCVAQTSYKILSTESNEEECEVIAIATGIFKQTFTVTGTGDIDIQRGRDALAENVGATSVHNFTDGSTCYISLNRPDPSHSAKKFSRLMRDNSAARSGGAAEEGDSTSFSSSSEDEKY